VLSPQKLNIGIVNCERNRSNPTDPINDQTGAG
jgi:hypothetical protein